jgi:toxin-antitoxin system PIN domain toxin
MTTPSETMLLDTNVLVYALDGSSPRHSASRAVLDRAHSLDANFCVAPQTLAEFFSLVTNPKRVSSPKSPEEALATVESIVSLPGIEVLPVPFDVVTRWVELCRKRPVRGAAIYDLQIAAVMLANGVQRICTFDTSDFEPFSEITVETP